MQVIKPYSAGEEFGNSLGQGLSQGLQMLAHNKLAQVQQKHAMQALHALGAPLEIAHLPQEHQGPALKEFLSQYGFPAPVAQQETQAQQPQEVAMAQTQKVAKQPVSKQAISSREAPIEEKIPELKQVRAKKVASEILQRAPRTMTVAQRKENRAEQHHIDKETKKLYDETVEAAKSAKNNDRRLNRMDELIKRGKLSSPLFHSALRTLSHGIFGFGIDLHSLESADSQEFDKLSKEFLKDAKDIFGSRITDADLKTFLKMVPDLAQTDSGKKRIIANMKSANQAAFIKKKALDDIIAENGGHRPRNLEVLIDKRVGPQLDQLSQEFSSREDEPVDRLEETTGLVNPLHLLSRIAK